MKNIVQFARGLRANYNKYTAEEKLRKIYFAEDSREIIVNGLSYQEGLIKNVEWSNDSLVLETVDGKFVTIPIPEATQENAGLMSAEDKKALDSIPNTYVTKEEYETATTQVFHYKGSVPTFTNLPTEGVLEGDTYNVVDSFTHNGVFYPAGTNVAWSGESWDPLGGSEDINLTEYTNGKLEYLPHLTQEFIRKSGYPVNINKTKWNVVDNHYVLDADYFVVWYGAYYDLYSVRAVLSNSEAVAFQNIYDRTTELLYWEEVTKAIEDVFSEGSGESTLVSDKELEKGYLLNSGGEVTINLNNHLLANIAKSQTSVDSIFKVTDGTLNITGNGTIDAGEGSYANIAVWASGENATVNIHGGRFTTGYDKEGGVSDTIYANSGGQINIYGGIFEGVTNTKGVTWTLNLQDTYSNGQKITCYGGYFKNFNPAKPGTERTDWTGTFIADGYVSEKVEGTENDWIVKPIT